MAKKKLNKRTKPRILLSIVETNLDNISSELKQIKEKMNKPSIVQIITVLLLLVSAIFLIEERKPNVVPTELKCPEFYNDAENFQTTLTNYGGSNTAYTVYLETNGFKCYKGSWSTYSPQDIIEWNRIHNQTECSVSYFIGVGSSGSPEFVIFVDSDKNYKNASFNLTYEYYSFLIVPGWTRTIVNGNIGQCNYKAVEQVGSTKTYELVTK